jgi:hypothetical protein
MSASSVGCGPLVSRWVIDGSGELGLLAGLKV